MSCNLFNLTDESDNINMGHSSLIRSTMTSAIELIWKVCSTFFLFYADQPFFLLS